MTAHDDPYENNPLDDEALDELLAAADLELLHHVQRHADPTRVLNTLMTVDEDVHERDHATRPVCDHLGSRPSKTTRSVNGSTAETERVPAVRRRRRLVILGAAAAAALIAATSPAVRRLAPGWPGDHSGTVKVSSVPQTILPGAEILQATNQKTMVTAKIALAPKTWGTQIAIELYGIRGPVHGQLIVIAQANNAEIVASWQVPAHQGYGMPGSPNPLRAQASTVFHRTDIDRFEFRTTTGSLLLNVPA
jgi:hypothetical protein